MSLRFDPLAAIRKLANDYAWARNGTAANLILSSDLFTVSHRLYNPAERHNLGVAIPDWFATG
jgi:hypothetical protein